MILTVNEQTSRLSNLLIELEEVGVEFLELLKHDFEFVGLWQDGGSEKGREKRWWSHCLNPRYLQEYDQCSLHSVGYIQLLIMHM